MSAVMEKIEAAPAGNEELHVAVKMTAEIQREVSATGALAVAQSYEIDCSEIAQSLADERKLWAQKIDRIKAMRKDLLQPAKDMLVAMQERVSKWFDPSLADLEAARDLAGQKLLAWDQAEKARLAREHAEREALARRLRQEAEAKAAAERAKAEETARIAREAEARAEAERQKQAAEAERLRREGNAKAAAEAEARAKAAAAEQAKQQEKAQAAVENGEARAQQATLQAAAQAQAAPVATVVKIAGQSTKESWLAVLNPGITEDDALAMIVEAIVKGDKQEDGSYTSPRRDLLALLKIDTATRGPLHRLAAAQKKVMRVPGYTAKVETSIAGSRK